MAPVSSLLLLVILALGVAAFFSIRLANEAAVAGFENFTGLITSASDGLITAPAGTLSTSVLTDLRKLLGNAPVNLVPVLETSAVPPHRSETEGILARPTYQILGLDLPALVNLSGQAYGDGGGLGAKPAGESIPADPGRPAGLQGARNIYISAALARRDQLTNGATLTLIINDHPVELRVAGLIPARPNQPAAPPSLMIMDLPVLQQLTDKNGRLDRIEFVLEPGPHQIGRAHV